MARPDCELSYALLAGELGLGHRSTVRAEAQVSVFGGLLK